MTTELAGIERELDKAGFDGVEANLRALVSLGSGAAGAYAQVLERIERALASKAKEPGLWALKGKVLSNLGRYAEARRALERASGARARVWLAETRLLQGDFKGAVSDLDKALKLEPDAPWALFHRAAAWTGLGETAKASADLGRAVGLGGPAATAARALQSLLAAREGRWEDALEALEQVARDCPGRGWPLALRARLHKNRGDRAACLKDLKEALEREEAGWIYLERSRVFEEMGDVARALEDVDRAIGADGPREELYLRRAHLQICRRHYHLAVPDYTEALKHNPGNVETLFARAMVHLIRNNPDGATADADSALENAKNDPGAALERLRVRIYAGRTDGLEADLAALEKKPDMARQAHFLRGCRDLKVRAYADAEAAFEKAIAGRDASDFDRKAAFHQTLARILGHSTEPPGLEPLAPDRARLLICGLGIFPPYTTSAETLRAVRSCDMIFNNLSEPEVAAMLWLVADDCEPTMYDIRGADQRWTDTIFRHVRPGRTVGFVTRGHPLVCGGLAHSLIEECQRRGSVDYRVFGSVSSVNTLAVRSLPGSGSGFWGMQVLDYSSLFSPKFSIETRVPVVLYFNSTAMILSRRDHDRFCEALEAAYGAEHPCLFYGRTFNMVPERIPLRELRQYHQKIDPSYTVLIPPKDEAA